MIEELVSKLIDIDEETWGIYVLKKDPLYNKLNYEYKKKIINKSNECGHKEAVFIKERYGIKSCNEYAKILGLEILEIEEKNSDDYVLFAKFNSPNKISICVNNIKNAEEIIKMKNINKLIDEVKIKDVLIAHEMFHFIETQKQSIYTKSEKIKLWQLGRIKYYSSFISLSEIAAMAFAKELLQLSYNPNLFDILFLYPYNDKKAKAIYNEVYAIKGAKNNA